MKKLMALVLLSSCSGGNYYAPYEGRGNVYYDGYYEEGYYGHEHPHGHEGHHEHGGGGEHHSGGHGGHGGSGGRH